MGSGKGKTRRVSTSLASKIDVFSLYEAGFPLSKVERLFALGYTSEEDDYLVNQLARHGSLRETDRRDRAGSGLSLEEAEALAAESTEVLDEICARACTPVDLEVWRGINHGDQVNVGDVITEPSFVSTSPDRRLAEYFLEWVDEDEAPHQEATLLQIRVPAGSKAAPLPVEQPGFAGARELLLARNTVLRVLAERDENGQRILEVVAETPLV
jgi:hypothetical protein